MEKRITYDFELLSEVVAIDNNCPTGLILLQNKKPIGEFEKDKDGNRKAIRIRVEKFRYLAHRVVWLLYYGTIDPDLDIDHIDGNPWNNKITNLRLVPKKVNQRNRKKMKNNSTGLNGVCIHTTPTGSGKYNTYVRAYWVGLNGKQVLKDFNVKRFETIELAIEFAELYRSLNIEDKETYTERHGT